MVGMLTRSFGPLPLPIPVIGQGTWQMEGDDEAESIRALVTGLDAGMTHVDTAEMYGSGRVEEIVGKAIAGRRDQVFLASKVLPRNASYEGTLRACERSLRRLGTDRLDLYLLHWRGDHPLAETFRAFDDLVQQGKIRAWGVSNFDAADMEEAEGLAGPGRIACNQVLYHLGERSIEHELVPWCEEHRVALVAYSPFGSGDFPPLRSSGGRALAEVAGTLGATARQVALAFLARGPAFVIPKASRVEHVVENAGAADLILDEFALARIERAFPRGPWRGLQTI